MTYRASSGEYERITQECHLVFPTRQESELASNGLSSVYLLTDTPQNIHGIVTMKSHSSSVINGRLQCDTDDGQISKVKMNASSVRPSPADCRDSCPRFTLPGGSGCPCYCDRNGVQTCMRYGRAFYLSDHRSFIRRGH